jgi:hypothetical protein
VTEFHFPDSPFRADAQRKPLNRSNLESPMKIRCWLLLTSFFLFVGSIPAAEHDLPWSKDLGKAVETARKSGKRVFVDFTADG